MEASGPVRSVLLGLTGMQMGGGIAVVGRCMVRVFEDDLRDGLLDRVDRVLLHDRVPAPMPHGGEQRVSSGSPARFAWHLWRMLRRHRHDLVVFDYYSLARCLQLPLPGFPPPRYAAFTHGFEFPSPLLGSRARAVLQASHLLANGEHSAGLLRALLPNLSTPVRPVALCVDPEREQLWSQREAPSADAEREPTALIVARMAANERGKGHDELVEAWPSVLESVGAARLWIAGYGDDVARLQARVRDLGLDGSVDFLGQVDATALTDLYRQASIFVMPSRQEGFGLVYAEAMWHGLPCIGSTADAAGEVIVDGETGLLVPYGDVPELSRAIVRLLADRDLRVRMGTAGFLRVRQEFSFARFRDNLKTALEIASR